MPTIFFVRDGTGDHRTSAGHHVPMTAVSGMSAHFPARFSASGPNINPGSVASAFAAYQHVVMEVEAGESTAELLLFCRHEPGASERPLRVRSAVTLAGLSRRGCRALRMWHS